METPEKVIDLTEVRLFRSLVPKFDWLSEEDASTLDTEYQYGHSGSKYLSPLMTRLIEKEGEENAMSQIVDIITVKFSDKWNRLRESFIEASYNPINNYDMKEEENIGSKKTSTDTRSRESTLSSTDKSTTTNSQNASSKGANENKRNGFNSPSAVPTGSVSTETETNGESSSEENSESTNTDSETENNTNITEGAFNDNHRILTRSGNIGVTTSAQMIQGEINLRSWSFYEMMMGDVDSVLTCSFYC